MNLLTSSFIYINLNWISIGPTLAHSVGCLRNWLLENPTLAIKRLQGKGQATSDCPQSDQSCSLHGLETAISKFVWPAADKRTSKVALCGHRTDDWRFSWQRCLEGRCASKHRLHDDSAWNVPESACWPRQAATTTTISHRRLWGVGRSRLHWEDS